jgi:hypothetical protein
MRSFHDYFMLRESNGEPASADINTIAAGLNFVPTSKKKLVYRFVATPENMPPMSYTVAEKSQPVVTVTADGKETPKPNVAEVNDIIMSGPSQEQYVIKSAKFPKLYTGQIGGPVTVEQSPRMVAVYTGPDTVMFKASFGADMVLKPNDYLVKEGDGKYYRIAKLEYEQTYNPPGKVG